jgi:uncharacterized protein involved in exopolysaccharide biosynthesis
MKNNTSSNNFLKPFYRGIPIIILIVTGSVLLAKRYLQYATPMYESTVKIKLADPKEGIPSTNLYKDLDVFANTNKIGTEIEMIKSEMIIEKAAAKMNIQTTIYRVGDIHKSELYNDAPFKVNLIQLAEEDLNVSYSVTINDNGTLEIKLPESKLVNARVNEIVKLHKSQIKITLNDSLIRARPGLVIKDHYEFIIHSPKAIVNSIISNLDITSVDKDIPILRISYKSAVAQKCADMVNTIANTYIEESLREKTISADTTEHFLSDQLKEYGDKLSNSETEIQNFRDTRNIINIRQETETDLRQISDLKKQMASVEMNLEAIDTLNQYLQKGKENFLELAPNFEAFTDLLSTEIVKNIKNLQAEKKELLIRYTPQYEQVIVVDKKIEDLTRYLLESVKNTETNLRIKRRNLANTIRLSEDDFVGLPEKEKSMTILERNFGMNEQIYRFLESKRTEAKIAKTAAISFHKIISKGEVPDGPVSPNKKLIIVFMGFLGFMFSLLGIYGIHSAKARVDDENIIFRNSDTPLETKFPFTQRQFEKNKALGRWALELELKNELSKGKIICISSVNKGEGKKYVTTGLASAVASMGKQTLMVTIDDRTVHSQDLQRELIYPSFVLEGKDISERWQQLTKKWSAKYDITIIKNLSISESSLSLLPMAYATTNYMVLDSRITSINDLSIADNTIEKLKLTSVKFILNREGFSPSLLSNIKYILNLLANVGK